MWKERRKKIYKKTEAEENWRNERKRNKGKKDMEKVKTFYIKR